MGDRIGLAYKLLFAMYDNDVWKGIAVLIIFCLPLHEPSMVAARVYLSYYEK